MNDNNRNIKVLMAGGVDNGAAKCAAVRLISYIKPLSQSVFDDG